LREGREIGQGSLKLGFESHGVTGG